MNWKTYKTFGLVLFGLLGSLRSEAQKDTLFLTLDQLFELGVRQSLQLQADTLHEAVALEREKSARAQQWPDLEVGLRGGFVGQPIVFREGLKEPYRPDAPDWSQNYAVDFSQPIYQGGKLRYAIRKANLERSLSNLQTSTDKADLKLTLLDEYMQLFSLYRQQQILSRNIEESQRRLQDIRRMKEEGLITTNNVLRSEMQLTDDELSLQETHNSIALIS